MLNRLNFINGVVMLVVAGTLVFVVTRKDDPAVAETEAQAAAKSPRDSGRPHMESRTKRPETGFERHDAFRGNAVAEVPLAKAGQLRSDLRVLVDRAGRQQGDLEERAQRVELFALRRLGVLTEELDLTAEQQARIFPTLVRGSQSYDPQMRIVAGSQARPVTPGNDLAASAPVDKSQEQALVQKELSAAQSEELVNQSINDLLIWEEIIDGLSNDLDRATPGQVDEAPQNGTAGTPATEAPAPAADPIPPESHGGRNLFGQ